MIGRTVGTYVIESELGRGGMGVVYKAVDLRLGRKAVLKFVAPNQLLRADARARLEKEARAVSALDHPNICTIFHIGDAPDGQLFLAMAYYEGETLEESISRGPMPMVEAVDRLEQIAAGLDEAHRRGIIHRDIKPSNVVVDTEGRARILDFGLAEARNENRPEDRSGTEGSDGSMVGTWAYLAPELLEGEPADEKTDLWALAVVAYEMLTGQPPFRGRSAVSVLGRILTGPPASPTELRSELPAGSAEVFARAFDHDPSARHPSARSFTDDLRRALAIEGSAGSPDRPTGGPPTRRPMVLALLLLAFGAALAGFSSYFLGTAPPPPRIERTRLLTGAEGLEIKPSVLAAGEHVVYTSDANGNLDVWILHLDSGRSECLTSDHPGLDAYAEPSPDGQWIAFVSDRDQGGIFVVPSTGGTARRLTPIPVLGNWESSLWIPNLTWHPDGERLVVSSVFGGSSPKWVHLDGRPTEPLATPPADPGTAFLEPAFSADGRLLALVEASGVGTTVSTLWQRNLEDEDAAWVRLTPGRFDDREPAYAEDGRRLYFVSDRGGSTDIWWFDLDARGRPLDAPRPLTTGVGVGSLAASRDGRLFYSKVVDRSNLWSMPLEATPGGIERARKITSENHVVEFVDISPDGRTIAFDSNRSGNVDLWLAPIEGGEPVALTHDPAHDWRPRFSPDGRTVVFYSIRSGNRDIWTVSTEDGTLGQLTSDPGRDWMPAWSADGRHVFFESSRSGERRIWRLPIDGGRAEMFLPPDSPHYVGGSRIYPVPSPDGRYLAFAGTLESEGDLFVVPIDGDSRASGPPRAFGCRDDWRVLLPFAWSEDASTIYFQGRSHSQTFANIWAATPADWQCRPMTLFDASHLQLFESLTVDSGIAYFPMRELSSDLWMAELAGHGSER